MKHNCQRTYNPQFDQILVFKVGLTPEQLQSVSCDKFISSISVL